MQKKSSLSERSHSQDPLSLHCLWVPPSLSEPFLDSNPLQMLKANHILVNTPSYVQLFEKGFWDQAEGAFEISMRQLRLLYKGNAMTRLQRLLQEKASVVGYISNATFNINYFSHNEYLLLDFGQLSQCLRGVHTGRDSKAELQELQRDFPGKVPVKNLEELQLRWVADGLVPLQIRRVDLPLEYHTNAQNGWYGNDLTLRKVDAEEFLLTEHFLKDLQCSEFEASSGQGKAPRKRKFREIGNLQEEEDKALIKKVRMVDESPLTKKRRDENLPPENSSSSLLSSAPRRKKLKLLRSSSKKRASCGASDCVICCCELKGQADFVAKLDSCSHLFHFECIRDWCFNSANTCPLCKNRITMIRYVDGEGEEAKVSVPDKNQQLSEQQQQQLNQDLIDQLRGGEDSHSSSDCEACYVCHDEGSFSHIIICDLCESVVCHTYCVDLPDDQEDFICEFCTHLFQQAKFDVPQTEEPSPDAKVVQGEEEKSPSQFYSRSVVVAKSDCAREVQSLVRELLRCCRVEEGAKTFKVTLTGEWAPQAERKRSKSGVMVRTRRGKRAEQDLS